MNEIDKLKLRFICETDGNFVNAALNVRGGRKVYKGSDVKESKRFKFREFWRNEVASLGKQYEKKVSEEVHCQNIKNLSDTLSEKYKRILNEDRLYIGVAQLSLNDYLKYWWCFNKIKTPPHCSVNRDILQEANIKGNWTECNCIEKYKEWMEKLKEKTGKEKLAEWELRVWLKAKDRRDKK